jgi:hypothetical protein
VKGLDADSLTGEVFRTIGDFGWSVADLTFALQAAGHAVTHTQVAGAVRRLRTAGKVETRGRGLEMVVRQKERAP